MCVCVSLTRWNEICHTALFAVEELIHAWQHGAINSEKVGVCRHVFNRCASTGLPRLWTRAGWRMSLEMKSYAWFPASRNVVNLSLIHI